MINKKYVAYLISSIVLTAMLPIGIVLIVLNAKHSSTLQTILFVLGIVFTVAGFYGSPVCWSAFGNIKSEKLICDQIKNDNVQSVKTLAELNHKEFDVMLKTVQGLMSKRFLTGYEIVDGQFIVPKTNKTLSRNEILEQTGQVVTGVCSGCGASYEIIGNNKTYCQYCGKRLIKK